MANLSFKNNISELADSYDYFILDIWGVLHDGSKTYPGAIEALKNLKLKKKKVYLLSNAPRRSKNAIRVLENLGINSDLYEDIITSGEAVFMNLLDSQNNNFNHYGKNYYYIGPDKDLDLLDDLNYNKVGSALDADFALVTGFDDFDSVMDEKLNILKECKDHNLKLICVNPDLIVIKQTGQEILCAGIIAQQYKDLGGEVIYFGKPYTAIYDLIFSLANISDKSQVIAIGDGIETDIRGANNIKIDSALIPGGILSNKLSINHGELPKEIEMKKLCKDYNIYPKFILAKL